MSDAEDTLEDFIEGDLLEDEHPSAQRQQQQSTRQQPPQSHIKSYIAILVSSLGGVDYSSSAPYKLGVEAFLCLQDIEKWIRSHDHKENSWEVAVACAESGLVNDLITILCMWNDTLNKKATLSGYSKRHDEIVAKMCLKLLVLLTWPLELTGGMYKRQLDYYSDLKKHQLTYKKQILNYRNGAVLQAIIKIALPVIAKDKRDREKMDYLVIRQCVAFFRNLLQIEPAGISKNSTKQLRQAELTENLPNGVNIDDVSIGACLAAFNDNLVFTFFLTMCSSIGVDRDFDPQLMVQPFQEIIHLMLRQLKPGYVMYSNTVGKDPQQQSTSSMGLSDLLSKEKDMVNKFKKHSSSRHGRFGTLLSLQTPDMGRLTVSNAGNLLGKSNPIAAFDSNKKWNKVQRFKYLPGEEVILPGVAVGDKTRRAFNAFVCDFIDGAFNPFIRACTRVLAANVGQVVSTQEDDQSKIQYVMTVAWFLEALRERYGGNLEQVDYTLVASALSDEAFVLLSTYLHEAVMEDSKKWGLAHACMVLFREVLYVGNTLSVSSLEDNRDIAANLKKRIFKDLYLDVVPILVKNAYKRSPDYVDTAIDLVDVLIKELNEYASADMKKVILQEKSGTYAKVYSKEQIAIDDLNEKDESALSRATAQLSEARAKTQRGLIDRLTHPDTVNTYISYIKRFQDVSQKSLKQAIKYLHMLFFSLKRYSLLYRLDFLLVIHTMLSPEGLPQNSNIRKHVEQFLIHFMKKFRESVEKTPTLYVEMLFPLMNERDMRHFLDTGKFPVHDVRAPKEIFVSTIVWIKDSEHMDCERQVSIIVACLLDDDQRELVEWASQELESIITTRLQEDAEDVPLYKEATEEAGPRERQDITIKANSNVIEKKLVTEPKLRYLLKLAGVTLPSSTADKCVFYGTADLERLITVNTYIKMYLMTPVELDEGKVAKDYLIRRSLKSVYQESNQNDDYDSDALQGAGYSSDEDDVAFADGDDGDDNPKVGYLDDELDRLEDAIDKEERSSQGRGVAKKKGGLAKSKKRSSRKKRRAAAAELAMHDISGDDDDVAEKPHRRVEHSTTFKSSKYILDSDDEDEGADAAFFARERKMRELMEQGDGKLTPSQVKELFSITVGEQPMAVESDYGIVGKDVPKRKPSPVDKDLESPAVKRRKETASDEELGGDLSSGSESSHIEDSTQEDVEADHTNATSEKAELMDSVKSKKGLFVSESEDEEDHSVKAPKRRVIIDDEDDDE